MTSKRAMRRVAAQMLIDAISAMKRMEMTWVAASMDLAPATRLSRKRPVTLAIPRIAPRRRERIHRESRMKYIQNFQDENMK
jgi:hypothetical protein